MPDSASMPLFKGPGRPFSAIALRCALTVPTRALLLQTDVRAHLSAWAELAAARRHCTPDLAVLLVRHPVVASFSCSLLHPVASLVHAHAVGNGQSVHPA